MRKAARCGNNSSTQHPEHDHVTQAAEPSRHAHMISDRTKIRDGVVANRPVYLGIGIDCEGAKQVLGLWVGPTTGESAKFWLSVLAELKGRGVADVCIVCCDGLTGLPDAISVTWPQAIVQLCVVHLIRASLRYASRKYWVPLTKDLKQIYTASDEAAAAAALEAFDGRWGERYPAIIKLWRAHWSEFTPFLAFPPEVRRVIYTTNLIESMNARLRKVTRNRGQFPSEQATLKVLYLAVRNLEEFRSPNTGIRSSGWKQALQAFTIYFDGRIPTP
jgi:transposase-like protein